MADATLVRVARSGKEHDPSWYRMHRRLSIGITMRLLSTPVRAVHVTITMMAVWLAGAALVAAPGLAVGMAGFGLLYLSFLLDKVDGELARIRRVTSARGILLDRIHHRIVEPTLFLAAAWHDYARRGDPMVLVYGFSAALLANVIEEHQQLAPYIFFKRLREEGDPGIRSRPAPPAWRHARALMRPLKIFRTPITVMPLLLACRLGEAASGLPLLATCLGVGAVALSAYLVFQCLDYYAFRLDEEFVEIAIRCGWTGRHPDPSEPICLETRGPVSRSPAPITAADPREERVR